MRIKQSLRSSGIITVSVNLILALLKTGVWVVTGSLSILSEAVNSWVDTVYSGVVVLGLFASTKEPTGKYPEGYRRIEPFVAIFISLGIILTALFVGYKAIQSINTTYQISNEYVGIIILLISAAVKLGLYKYCMKIYKSTNSPIMKAIGVDNRNDILTGIIAFIGIIGSMLGYSTIDTYGAIIISIAILYSGIDILIENSEYVLARSVPDEEVERIKESALSNESVQGLHDVQIHYSGPQVDVSMHLEVDGGLSIEEGHKIERSVADNIRERSEYPINEINLHIDPKSLYEWSN